MSEIPEAAIEALPPAAVEAALTLLHERRFNDWWDPIFIEALAAAEPALRAHIAGQMLAKFDAIYELVEEHDDKFPADVWWLCIAIKELAHEGAEIARCVGGA